MAEDALDFPALRAVLQDLAADIRAGYVDQLTVDDHIASGDLVNTMKVEVRDGDNAFSVVMDVNKYWKYLEEGISPAGRYGNPGWKAYPFIRKWIDVKPVIPRPGPDGRLPSPEQLAFLITRKIVEEGTTPSRDLEKTKDKIIPSYQARIRAAIVEDLRSTVILKVLPSLLT